jgi:hypothetical protein
MRRFSHHHSHKGGEGEMKKSSYYENKTIQNRNGILKRFQLWLVKLMKKIEGKF